MTRFLRPLAIIAGVLLLAGCTTNVAGSAHPVWCTKALHPRVCSEVRETPPATNMFHVWKSEPAKATHMLCSAVSEQKLEQIMGGRDTYRFVINNKCIIHVVPKKSGNCLSGECGDRLTVYLYMFAWDPLSEYVQSFEGNPSLRDHTKLITIAGRPAMQYWVNYGGDHGDQSVELTIAPHGQKNKPGVLFIELKLNPPRGAPLDASTDTSRLKMRDELATAVLKGAFS